MPSRWETVALMASAWLKTATTFPEYCGCESEKPAHHPNLRFEHRFPARGSHTAAENVKAAPFGIPIDFGKILTLPGAEVDFTKRGFAEDLESLEAGERICRFQGSFEGLE